jgi:uncharacterized protein DUF6546
MEIRWSSLPVEIRRMIVSQMFQIVYKDRWNNDDVEPPYTSLPLVCREFYHYFAHINFRVLVLDQHRLGEFERIVLASEMRQQYVELIYLRARLPWSETEAEDALEESAACRANETAFLETVHDFMAIMSRWKKICLSDNVEGIKIRLSNKVGGIKLHLGAIWPSPEREVAPISLTPAQEFDLHSTQGFEARSLHVATLSAAPGSQRAYAPAPIFDGFAILRSHPRCISPGFLDQLISEGMPRLKNFQYQPWDVLQIVANQRYRDECFRVLDVLHRNKVCSLGLFYDSSISFHPHTLGPSLLDSGFYYAMLATGLRFCCMSSFDDSTNFLTYIGDLYFPELECLVLKSSLLSGSGFHLDPPDLVKILALVIFSLKDMPKLKVLDIWKRDAEHMFLVRIVPLTRKLPNRNVAIVWYSNWLTDDDLVEPFEKLRQISLSVRWRPFFWREQNMEPAKDQRQWHRANYSGVHRRIKRVGRRLLSSLSETL